MIRPTLDLAVAFNRVSRAVDEWFVEPDDLERVRRTDLDDVVEAAATVHDRSGPSCGVWAVDIRSARIVASARFDGAVREVFDVLVLDHRRDSLE